MYMQMEIIIILNLNLTFLYSNDLYKLENSVKENIILTTGEVDQFKANNIYDYFENVG